MLHFTICRPHFVKKTYGEPKILALFGQKDRKLNWSPTYRVKKGNL